MVGAARVVREQPMQSSNKDGDEKAVVQPVSAHHAGCCAVDEV